MIRNKKKPEMNKMFIDWCRVNVFLNNENWFYHKHKIQFDVVYQWFWVLGLRETWCSFNRRNQ